MHGRNEWQDTEIGYAIHQEAEKLKEQAPTCDANVAPSSNKITIHIHSLRTENISILSM